MLAVSGQRDALIAILAASSSDMPGCRGYVIAKDSGNSDAIGGSEVWESVESHKAS
jgi:quinol monooxygenase YgiN